MRRLRFAAILKDQGITQAEVRQATGVPRSTLNATVKRGRRMVKRWQPGIETFLQGKGIETDGMWGRERKKTTDEEEREVEIAMKISAETKRWFKIAREPFLNDVRNNADMYMNDGFQAVETALVDVVENGGFLLVIGESGVGKTEQVLRLMERYADDDSVNICRMQMIDGERMTGSHIYARLLKDITGIARRRNAEVRHDELIEVLEEEHRKGTRSALVVDDAHDLHAATLRKFKRFYDLRGMKAEGRRRLLGVVMMGQRHIVKKLVQRDLREVTNRVEIIEMKGLDGDVADYLRWKFERPGVLAKGQKFDAIFEKQALTALGKVGLAALPQELHRLVKKILTEAAKLRYRSVSRDVVESALAEKGEPEEEGSEEK